MMKKDIYIIKNDINNKVYIGQSVNTLVRFQAHHKSESKLKSDNMLIHKAMRKYGFEHFYVEILESQIENYDEREVYWIQYYNSVQPNGYNISLGGIGVSNGINHPTSKIKDLETLEMVYDLILNSSMSFDKIGEKVGISPSEISNINLGNYYFNSDLNYPLRSKNYSEDLLKRITYSIKYELDKTLQNIADEYNVDYSQISLINQGKIYYREYLTYPLRISKELRVELIAHQIIEELLNTPTAENEIAKKFHVSKMTVSNINLGIKHKDEKLSYPLRKNYQNSDVKTLSQDLLNAVIDDIKNTKLSMNAIGRKYEIDGRIICGINSGSIKKYRLENYKYPIRNKK